MTAFGFWQIAHLTTYVSAWDIFWPQLWQGVGFSLICVALSTAALSTIAKPQMTAATGLYNVIRQVMGSVGVALAATELISSTPRHHDVLAVGAGMSNPAAVSFLRQATAAMVQRGADMGTARQRALKLLNDTVTRHTARVPPSPRGRKGRSRSRDELTQQDEQLMTI